MKLFNKQLKKGVKRKEYVSLKVSLPTITKKIIALINSAECKKLGRWQGKDMKQMKESSFRVLKTGDPYMKSIKR